MWLSQREKRPPGDSAQVGAVTLPGAAAGAYLDGERRDVALFAPGGYHWAPALGQEILVVKNGGVGGGHCALGVKDDQSVAPGEVLIAAPGASIRLKTDGSIELTGTVKINGTALDDLLSGEGS